jgi:hypothetical protein
VMAPSNEQVAWIPLHKMFNTEHFHWKDLSESEYLCETRVDGRATVKIILNSRVGGRGLNSPGSGRPPVAGIFKHEMNHWSQRRLEIYWPAKQMLDSQRHSSSTYIVR